MSSPTSPKCFPDSPRRLCSLTTKQLVFFWPQQQYMAQSNTAASYLQFCKHCKTATRLSSAPADRFARSSSLQWQTTRLSWPSFCECLCVAPALAGTSTLVYLGQSAIKTRQDQLSQPARAD